MYKCFFKSIVISILSLIMIACDNSSATTATGEAVDISKYFLPSTNSVITVDEIYVSDGVVVFRDVFTESFEVNVDTVIATDDEGNVTTFSITTDNVSFFWFVVKA